MSRLRVRHDSVGGIVVIAPGISDDPMLLEGVDYWKRLIEDTFPPEAANWNFLEHLDFFAQGRLASAELWPEGVLTVEDGESAGNVGYSVLPRWEGNYADLDVGRSFIGGGGVLVFDTPRKEAAFDFLHWMLVENSAEFNARTAMSAIRNVRKIERIWIETKEGPGRRCDNGVTADARTDYLNSVYCENSRCGTPGFVPCPVVTGVRIAGELWVRQT
ncbi:MAG: extracellular solute-binding protein [Alkalispirochaeta sp.]